MPRVPTKPKQRAETATDKDAIVADILRDAPALMTYEAAARITGISARTWRRWTRQGLVMVVRPAGVGHPRLPRAAVAETLKKWLTNR